MVKPGYKQTEIGVIPEDWEVFDFGENFDIYAGGDVPKHSLSQVRSETYPHPIFANAIKDHGLYGYTAETRSRADSITITARGYLGHAEYRGEPFFPIVRLLVMEPKGELDARFATYAINERVEFAIESTGVPQLTAPQVARYAVAGPCEKQEQKAIADALSDVDGLIAALEALIAKKRALKTATMQQLLTGKTRLPGFEGKWKARQLNEFTVIRSGVGFPLKLQGDTSSKVPFFKVSDFNPSENATSMKMSNNYLSEQVVAENGFTPIPTNSIIVAKIGAAVFLERKRILENASLIDNNMMALSFSETEADYRFLHQLLLTIRFSDLVSTTALPSLSSTDVGSLTLQLPELDEQRAIAEVLIDIDAEIEHLETRLSKTKALKQGMMQELLTGRTQLI